MEEKDEFIKDFITVGELRKMLSNLGDNEMITVNVLFNERIGYHKIKYVEDSTSIGFWELKCE